MADGGQKTAGAMPPAPQLPYLRQHAHVQT